MGAVILLIFFVYNIFDIFQVRNCLMVSVFTSLVCFCFLIVETFFLVVYYGKHYMPYKLMTSVICCVPSSRSFVPLLRHQPLCRCYPSSGVARETFLMTLFTTSLLIRLIQSTTRFHRDTLRTIWFPRQRGTTLRPLTTMTSQYHHPIRALPLPSTTF